MSSSGYTPTITAEQKAQGEDLIRVFHDWFYGERHAAGGRGLLEQHHGAALDHRRARLPRQVQGRTAAVHGAGLLFLYYWPVRTMPGTDIPW